MGIDIMNRRWGSNWAGWECLFELGLKYGWKPMGTQRPDDFEGDWKGGYFSNDLQTVTAEDAKNWSDAIFRAIDAMKSTSSSPNNVDPILSPAPWLKDDKECIEHRIAWIEEFARIAAKGEMVLF